MIDQKKLLIDAIMSHEPVNQMDCVKLTELGFMRFTGNQWNEEWSWNRDKLETLDEETLTRVYEDFTVLLS